MSVSTLVEIWLFFLSVALAAAGTVWKMKHKENEYFKEKVRDDLTDFRVNYVHKTDFRDLKSELSHRFDKLEVMIQSASMPRQCDKE